MRKTAKAKLSGRSTPGLAQGPEPSKAPWEEAAGCPLQLRGGLHDRPVPAGCVFKCVGTRISFGHRRTRPSTQFGNV